VRLALDADQRPSKFVSGSIWYDELRIVRAGIGHRIDPRADWPALPVARRPAMMALIAECHGRRIMVAASDQV